MLATDIYSKTAQGQAEIESAEKSLSMQERRVLILVNGEKDAATLGKLSLTEDASGILSSLLQRGLIEKVADTAPAPSNAAANSESRIEAREFLCNTLMTYGNRVRVRKLVEQIVATESPAELKNLITPWYQAISDTPNGMYQADKLRDQVMGLLEAEEAAGAG